MNWDTFYSENLTLDTEPEKYIIDLVTQLKKDRAKWVFDAGCGAGRNGLFLATQGFNVRGVDISQKAVEYANTRAIAKSLPARFTAQALSDLTHDGTHFDLVFSIHAFEYGTLDSIKKAAANLNNLVGYGKRLFLTVDSTEHPFLRQNKEHTHEISHIAFAKNNNIPTHFFTKKDLLNLFPNYEIKRLEHIFRGDEDTTVSPIREWVFEGIKK